MYLPMLCKQIRRHGTIVISKTPLFPRYLFVNLTDGLDDWGPIRSTRSVSCLVSFGGKPAHVPNRLITNIRKKEMEDGFLHEEIPELSQGDKVHICDGPFSGYEAIFQAKSGKDRVLLLMDAIGKATNIEISIDSITQEDSLK